MEFSIGRVESRDHVSVRVLVALELQPFARGLRAVIQSVNQVITSQFWEANLASRLRKYSIERVQSWLSTFAMTSRSPSRGRERSRTRSPTPRSASSRSPSPRRRRYDSRDSDRSPTPPSRRNGRHRSGSRSWSRGRGRGGSREASEDPPIRSTKVI